MASPADARVLHHPERAYALCERNLYTWKSFRSELMTDKSIMGILIQRLDVVEVSNEHTGDIGWPRRDGLLQSQCIGWLRERE